MEQAASAGRRWLPEALTGSRARAFTSLGSRLAGLVATLLASSFVVYSSLYLAPGSPVDTLSGGRPLSPAATERLREEYDLNDPFFTRYWHWLTGALHGDFGRSTFFHQDIGTLLSPRIGTTLFLVVFASLLIVAIGIALGVVAGLGGRRTRTAVTASTAVGMGIPSFVASVGLIALFSVQLGWFPVTGSGDGLFDRLWHLTLPAIALALAGVAYVARVAAASIRTEAAEDHVATAIGRGIPRRRVVRRHIVRNALIPITTVSGLTVAGLVAGTAVVEQAFQLNGLGSFLISSVNSEDFPAVQAICLIIVAVFLIVNSVVDGLYRLLDPRLRGAS